MELISVERRAELLADVRDLLKLELRDNYASDAALLTAWLSGDVDAASDVARAWAETVAADLKAGGGLRRVRVISEPLSEYQRMAVTATSGAAVDAGEDL